MENFRTELALREVLGLYLALEEAGEDERTKNFRDSLRSYLYELLSIADMEEPEALYEKLGGSPPPARAASSKVPARRIP